jgi:hypothetical protein
VQCTGESKEKLELTLERKLERERDGEREQAEDAGSCDVKR